MKGRFYHIHALVLCDGIYSNSVEIIPSRLVINCVNLLIGELFLHVLACSLLTWASILSLYALRAICVSIGACPEVT